MNLAYHSVVHVLWFFLSKKTNYNHLWLAFSFGISRAGLGLGLGLLHCYRELLWRAWTCRQWL